MKALQLSEDKQLDLVDLDLPKPEQDEVLIKIKAAALNHRELWIRKGLYPGMKLPCILGADGAGLVVEIGSNVSDVWNGKEVIIYPAYDWGDDEDFPSKNFRVLGMPDPGTIAEYVKVPTSNLFEKPKYLSWEEAAALPIGGLTAWRALVTHGKVKSGQNVLITGIGGGVAQFAMQIALAHDAKVFVTSSSERKINDAITQGAKAGVNYKTDNWHSNLKDISGGIHLVIDSSPADKLDSYFKFMRHGGKIVAYGSTGSRHTTVNISKMFLRHIQFIGTAMGSPKEFGSLLSFVNAQKLKPSIHKVFEFSESLKAIEELETGNQIGKVLIRIN